MVTGQGRMQLGLDYIRSRGQRAEGLGSGCLLLEHYLSLIILHVPLKFTIIHYLTLTIPVNINSDEKCFLPWPILPEGRYIAAQRFLQLLLKRLLQLLL